MINTKYQSESTVPISAKMENCYRLEGTFGRKYGASSSMPNQNPPVVRMVLGLIGQSSIEMNLTAIKSVTTPNF